MFGAGFVTLEYLIERMPSDVYDGWAAFYDEWHKHAKLREEIADHTNVMDKAARALGG